MLNICIVCTKYFYYNHKHYEIDISDYFLFDEFKNELNLKFLEMIIKEKTIFCQGCIKLGLYIHENDQSKLLNRIKILIRKYNQLSSTSTSTRNTTSNCSRNTRTSY